MVRPSEASSQASVLVISLPYTEHRAGRFQSLLGTLLSESTGHKANRLGGKSKPGELRARKREDTGSRAAPLYKGLDVSGAQPGNQRQGQREEGLVVHSVLSQTDAHFLSNVGVGKSTKFSLPWMRPRTDSTTPSSANGSARGRVGGSELWLAPGGANHL